VSMPRPPCTLPPGALWFMRFIQRFLERDAQLSGQSWLRPYRAISLPTSNLYQVQSLSAHAWIVNCELHKRSLAVEQAINLFCIKRP
jgi:hypothetical protein